MRTQSSKINNEPAITVKDLHVKLGLNEILCGISFEVQRSSITAIIGPNGAGKTTLIRAMMGLISITSGEIVFNGGPVAKAYGSVGYVPQRLQIERSFPITVDEFMGLVRVPSNTTWRSQKNRALNEVGLQESIGRQMLGTLSGGQFQRAMIAQAILNNPRYLFLDEPSSSIDAVGESQFHELIHTLRENHGTTILLVSHDVTFVSGVVDNVLCVNRRLMCSGNPKRVLSQKLVDELFGAKIKFDHHDHRQHT